MEWMIITVAAIALGAALYVWATYNALIALRNNISETWSDIGTELKRRHNLIPNLIETTKSYIKYEHETLVKIVAMRNQCLTDPTDISQQAANENMLTAAIRQLMVVAEDYPDLKASETFCQLQKELANTEDRIQAARRLYNGNVRDMRTKCQIFPNNIIANRFNFKPQEFFNLDPAEKDVPSIKGAF